MSNKRFSLYKDKDKLREYRKRHKNKYYAKNRDKCFNAGQKWSIEEIKLILFAPKTDTELSVELGRSIGAIQTQRHMAKKHLQDFL